MSSASGRMNAKRVIGGISFLLIELGIFYAAASAEHVSPVEGIRLDKYASFKVRALGTSANGAARMVYS
jgi:hypothetical protein